jgi:hypothetical protein
VAEKKLIKAVIQFRRGLAADWTSVNPTLRQGEPGFETDTGLMKIGDGVHNWRDLKYINDGEVDEEFSPVSVHPVQNRVITQAIQSIEDRLNVVDGKIVYGTTEYWDSLEEFIAQENVIYVYTDGFEYQTQNIVRFKVGDGQTYLKDLSYTDMIYYDHVSDPTIHVSATDREFWNNKVSCYTNGENLVFTTSEI